MDKEAQTLTTQSSGSPGRSLAAFGFLVLPNYPLRWASSRRAFSFASTVMNGMFRVWDGEMHLPPHNFVRDGEGNLYQWEQISGAYYEVVPVKGEVMRSTGRTDAEATEIYEGDLIIDVDDQQVVGNDLDEAVWGIVKFGHHSGELEGKSTDGSGFYWTVPYIDNSWSIRTPKSWVVIGNRYENPELLEQNTTPA